MFKQFTMIFSLAILICSVVVAQEKPEKETEETQSTTELKTEQVSETKIDSEELEAWNKVCPVEGGPIDEDTPTVEYNGKVYGFCCPGCDEDFAKNPEKYSKNLNEAGTRYIGRK